MKITENKKGRCTGCCAAALSAGLDGTYDFLLVAPVFLYPAAKDAKNHLTNCYRGGVLYKKSRLHKKVIGACKKIVRLILMSNISRRQFLKGAGVAALAVAAAGVLAGCSNNDIPVTPNKPGSSDIPENPSLEKPVYDALFVRSVKTLSQDNGLRSLASDLAKAQIAGTQQEVRARIMSNNKIESDDGLIYIVDTYSNEMTASEFSTESVLKAWDDTKWKLNPQATNVSIAAKTEGDKTYYAMILYTVVK